MRSRGRTRRCFTIVELDHEVHAEIVSRLVKLRDLSRELADAFDDPVSKRGAEEMRESLERVLQLLGHK
jgi:hypothetical protein